MTNSIVLIRHMLGAIERIEQYTLGISEGEFMNNFLIQDAVIRNLEIIGEASLKIDRQIKEATTEVPWKEISGMRNKLIHEYFGVDLNTVWVVIIDDLPSLKQNLIAVLNNLHN